MHERLLSARTRAIGVDKLGVLIFALILAGVLAPFAVVKPNRILPGSGLDLTAALPVWEAVLVALLLACSSMSILLRVPVRTRLVASLGMLGLLLVAIGHAATFLTPEGDRLVRVAPGTGFWVLGFALALSTADSLVRLRLRPGRRLLVLGAIAAAVTVLLVSGLWNDLSVMREYANRADSFWREGQTHIVLALGSLVAATAIGVPLGTLCQRLPKLRIAVLNMLNAVQTIPSIALFGLLIAPLAWVAANVPGAAALGVSGIGVAPALIALFAYSLLPVVANTVVGIDGVPASATDAARGMGMTGWQRLTAIEFPLAFPVILTGIRIVLVQNIGLATIAALIGGGGFGVFIFQGVGQTALDLVLLGAVPTVALAFVAAVSLDALVEILSPKGVRHD